MNTDMTTLSVESDILRTMEKRVACFRDMVSLSLEQQEILISGAHDLLNENVARQDAVLMRIDQLTRLCDTLQAESSEADPSLTERIGLVKNQTAFEAERVRSITRANWELLRNAADFAAFTMGLIAQDPNDQRSYDHQASTDSDPAAAIILDAKV